MSATEQTKGQTILQHGESIWNHTKRLIVGDFEGFRLPEWFIENHDFIVNQLPPWQVIEKYTVFHDCGKPYCRVIGEGGKQHFPAHAEVSYKTFLEVFPDEILAAELIRLDMLLHTESYENMVARNLPLPILATLLLSAFAEIHSNAAMFGGVESTSFKIKWKKIDRIGKRLIMLFPSHVDSYSYLVVREDLPGPQKVVQSAHAVFELAKEGILEHPSLIAMAVKDERKLKKVMSSLIDKGIQFKIFREPLHNGEITAIATEPLVGDRRKALRRLQLMR